MKNLASFYVNYKLIINNITDMKKHKIGMTASLRPFSAILQCRERGKAKVLEKYYAKVKGIVHKCRKDYYLHLWGKEDWDQEGMICLHELLEVHPELVEEEKKLYVYFKTKFRNRILDSVRKQESQKRSPRPNGL